jgi:hypothetical protein
MKIVYDGASGPMREAADYANGLAANSAFWDEIKAKAAFTYGSRLSGTEVERRLRAATSSMTVKLWRPSFLKKFFYRKTVAFVDPGVPHTLFYHEKFLGNSVGELVNTFVHEYIHDVDEDGAMTHGDNSPSGKEDSVPYWVGNKAEEYYNRDHGINAPPKGIPGDRVVSKAADGQTLN